MMVISLVTVSEIASAYTPEDVEFIEWASDVDVSGIYSDKMSSAYERRDYDAMELYAGLQYDYYNEKLSEIDQFSVSLEMQPIKDE